jgi:hypothetical protein
LSFNKWQKTSSIEHVVWSDRWKSIQKVSLEVGVSVGSTDCILHKDLKMHCLWQCSVPKMLTPEHKETRMTLWSICHIPWDSSPPDSFLLPLLKVFWKDRDSQGMRKSLQKRQEHWERYRQIVSRNNSKSFTNVDKRELLWRTCCVNRHKMQGYLFLRHKPIPEIIWSYQQKNWIRFLCDPSCMKGK